MKSSLTLNPGRIGLLLKKEVFYESKKLWIAIGAIFVLMTIGIFAVGADSSDLVGVNYYVHEGWYSFFLVMGGFVYSSYAFSELNDKLERASYLSLPASHLEKFTSKWLQTFIFFPIAFTILYFIYSWIIYFIFQYFDYISLMPLQIFSTVKGEYIVFTAIKSFMASQAIFLLAAVTFRKFEFFKVILTMFGLSIIFLIISGIGFRIIFADLFNGIFTNNMVRVLPGDNLTFTTEDFIPSIIGRVACIVLPIFFWIVGYFKLTEKEA